VTLTGNETRDLTTYNEVPQPNAPPRTQFARVYVSQRDVPREGKTENKAAGPVDRRYIRNILRSKSIHP